MSNQKKKFYITTAIPYVNARPHLGHALEFVQADVLARFNRIKGKEVLLLSGSDDNALKNVQAAEAAKADVQKFVDLNAELFADLAVRLNVKFDIFQHGSDKERHYPSSQKLWELCSAAGDIYKKKYEGLYCVGCEVFYAPEELNEQGECFEHPGKKLEKIFEENYFFRLSRYQEKLTELISSDVLRVTPQTRKNEVLSFLKQPLQDISISRTNERAKNWGVPVPGDNSQRIYVWFDALNIYQSGVGFEWDDKMYQKWWPADAHLIGKGIIRFHAVYWPAFLLSAKLPLPKALFVHGYITVDGQKMSKTVGNVIDPFGLVEKYGQDPVRYYLLREILSQEDGDFSYKKFEERYNGDLANGLGNLVARVAALGEKLGPIHFDFSAKGGSAHGGEKGVDTTVITSCDGVFKEYERHLAEFRLNEALIDIWKLVSLADKYINEKKPWMLAGEDLKAVIVNAGYIISTIADLLEPFLPDTAEKIKEQIHIEDSKLVIRKEKALFPRLGETPH